MPQPMSLDELKTAVQQYSEVKGDADNARWVPLRTWKGFWSGTDTPNMSVQIDYYLEGNRVRVKRAMDKQEYWYTLR